MPTSVRLILHGILTQAIVQSRFQHLTWLMPTPQFCRLSHSLGTLLLDSNNLSGRIPPAIAFLPYLSSMRATSNAFSCSAPSVNSTSSDQCRQDELLPCFLEFSSYTVPRADASNMQCPTISRKTRAEIVQDCNGTGPHQLVSKGASLQSLTASMIPSVTTWLKRQPLDTSDVADIHSYIPLSCMCTLFLSTSTFAICQNLTLAVCDYGCDCLLMHLFLHTV